MFKNQDKDKDLSSKDKDSSCKDQDKDKDSSSKDKDCIIKDKDEDKDCILVLKESLRTRTRTNITVSSKGKMEFLRVCECMFELVQRLCIVRCVQCEPFFNQ